MKNSSRLGFVVLLGLITLGVLLPRHNLKSEDDLALIGENKIASVAIEEPIVSTESILISATISAKPVSEISSGVFITNKGDDLLVLVNKKISLPATYAPKDLVSIEGKVSVAASGLVLRKEAANALAKMSSAAKKENVNLVVISAYRSYATQQNTFQAWMAKAGLEQAETFSARPGHSQHQLGTAVDFTSYSGKYTFSEGFGSSTEGGWLSKNAAEFGFVLSYPKGKEAITGYMYEPWHYRYIGFENAQKMISSGLCLEEFLQKFGVF